MAEPAPTPLDYSAFEALDARIAPPKTSLLYHFALVLVAVTMVLLPLVYLAFVGTAAWAVYYHAVYNWSAIMGIGGRAGSGRFMILKFIIYLTPLIIGVLIVFFLFKPIFARRPRAAQPLALNPASEPLLYAFIEKVCDAVGAPSPKRIDLDCDLNAAAGFRRGFLSFLGHDLVLVIGLPLVANFNIQELAGVVAHEFGHFTQGMGMRVSYLIRAVNFWFARVCYERDAWDVALEQWASEVEDAWAGIVVWTAQIGIWMSRLILKLLMLVGHLIGGFMLRQMEYDADSYQIRVAGSEVFETTHRKFATLRAAMEQSGKQLTVTWKKYRTLPDNLPEILRRERQNLPADAVQRIEDRLGLEPTGLFDSHPSAADRIRRARWAAEPGIFHDERPASLLFGSFDHPCRFVTLLHYTDDLGMPITRQMLTAVQPERPAGAPAAAAAAAAAPTATDDWESYFLGVLHLMLPLRLKPPLPSSHWDADMAELNQLSANLRQVSGQLASVRDNFDQVMTRLMYARAGRCLLTNGMTVDPGQFGRTESTVEAAASAEKEALAARDALRFSLHEVAAALTRRLELGLSLALAGGLSSPEAEFEIDATVAALNEDAAEYANRRELADALNVLGIINGIAEVRGGSAAAARAFDRQLQAVFSLSALAGQPAEPPPPATAAGLRLQNKPRGPINMAELSAVSDATQQWFANHRARLEKLVQAAQAIEGIQV